MLTRLLHDAGQDLRYTLRTLRRDAGFATFAILIVGLGIGASSTIFSVVDALLLRPLPLRDASRLVWLANIAGDQVTEWSIQVGSYLELRAQSKSIQDMAAYFTYFGNGDAKLTGEGEPVRLSGVPVTQNFFSFLGVQPILGRYFNAEECKWKGAAAVMLSYPLWQRHFGSNPDIIGRKLTLNDEPVTVVGVLPEYFDFSAIFTPGRRVDFFKPFPLSAETNRWGNTLGVIGRLQPGMTAGNARAEIGILAKQIEAQHPDWNGVRPKLVSLEQHISGRLRPALLVLACAVGVVMLIVCANLSNLQLARTATRQKEMAVRVALGAGRHRLMRQMLTESIVLSCSGAVLGLILAVAGTRALSNLEAFSTIPLLHSVRLDFSALSFTLLISVLTGVLFGLLPAIRVPGLALHDTLKESGRSSSEGRRHAWIRSTLVVSEIAFACVLLVGAGLLMRSLLHVLEINLGFQPESAAALRIDPSSRYSSRAQRIGYMEEALRRVRALPGIAAAGIADLLPLGGDRSWNVYGQGQVWPKGRYPEGFVRVVSEGYLHALGVPLRAGRDFTETDTASSDPVALINETLARTLWPGENPIGKVVVSDGPRRVVGVVGDVRHRALEQDSGCEVYFPIRQYGSGEMDLVVRTTLTPAALASAVRGVLRPLDPTLPANEFRTLQQLVDKAVSARRFVVYLLGGFAAFALTLASLGIYAVISYSVNQRTQEFGIRMALGASGGNLQRRILVQTLRLAAIGMAVGVAVSWAVSRLITGLLFGVTSTDPVTFGGMLAVLGLVAALAGYLPARRASRIDPMVALRAN